MHIERKKLNKTETFIVLYSREMSRKKIYDISMPDRISLIKVK